MLNLRSVLFSLALILLASLAAKPGRTNDLCAGSTLCVGSGQHYRTIQAAADAVMPGQTVIVMDGSYAGFHTVHPGTATAPITFKANSANVVINSAGDSAGDCVNIDATDYVIVEGFHVNGCRRAGIRSVLSTGVIIRNNLVTEAAMWGIFTGFTPRIQILNNRVWGTKVQHGIYVSNSDSADDNPVIRGNESWGNAGAGIQLNGDCQTKDPNGHNDGVISGALIEDNRLHDNQSKPLSLIDVQSSRIQNNLIYNNGLKNGAAAIHLASEDGCENDPSSGNVIVNNTILESRIAAIRITTGTHNVIFNNIAIGSRGIVDETDGPNEIDRRSNIQEGVSPAFFVNSGASDFHPAAVHGQLDAGLASFGGKSAPSVDHDGHARPQGANFHIGAYE